MFDIRNRLERGFSNSAGLIYENRYKTLLIMLAMVAILVSQLPKITFDLSNEGFLHENDPYRIDYNEFRDQFGREELVIIALRPLEIFDLNFLTSLKALHEDLEQNVPHLDDIKSLINARNTHGEGETLIVDDLLQDFPKTQEGLAAVKQMALANPMYKNLLLSEDGKFTTIVIQTSAYSAESETDVLEGFDDTSENEIQEVNNSKPKTYLTDKENGEVVEAVEEILKRHNIANTRVFVAGSPIVIHFLKRAMLKDMPRFSLIAIVIISIFLFIMFRRISAVLMPLCIVFLSILSTFGLMAATGVPFKLPTKKNITLFPETSSLWPRSFCFLRTADQTIWRM